MGLAPAPGVDVVASRQRGLLRDAVNPAARDVRQQLEDGGKERLSSRRFRQQRLQRRGGGGALVSGQDGPVAERLDVRRQRERSRGAASADELAAVLGLPRSS